LVIASKKRVQLQNPLPRFALLLSGRSTADAREEAKENPMNSEIYLTRSGLAQLP
jgi:hypothetical protein